MVDYDETGSIGKRYRRQDEIGTPFCITVDFETVGDDEHARRPAASPSGSGTPWSRCASPSARSRRICARSARSEIILPHFAAHITKGDLP